MAAFATGNRRVWLTAYAPVFVWIGFIFLMSSDLGSSSHTSVIIRPLLEFLFRSASPETLDQYQGYIRKAAHLTEYAILGFLAARMFRGTAQRIFYQYWGIWSVLLVIAVAALDEWHQGFVGSRTSSPYDVMLDAAGGLLAVLIVAASVNWPASERLSNR